MNPRAFSRALALVLATALAATAAVAPAEVDQVGNLRVSVEGGMQPRKLPRRGKAPVAVSFSGRIATTDGTAPPQLRSIEIALNGKGRLDTRGLPRCNYHQIQPSTTVEALATCGDSLVGKGLFAANVALPDQSPFPSNGRILAFNGNLHGRSVVYAHIYGEKPLPTSFVLPFEISRGSGRFGLRLVAELPQVAAEWGFVSGVSLTLDRRFRARGREQSYLSAGCPAPAGFPGATFAFAKASFGFEDGRVLETVLNRRCAVQP